MAQLTWRILTDKHATSMQAQDCHLVRFESITSDTLDAFFRLTFLNGKEFNVCLNEQKVCRSFYTNDEIYDTAKPPSRAIIDIELTKGGPEAIAESYYCAMRAQQQSGGQANETLGRRTKLNWWLLSLRKCDTIIQEGVTFYLKGDDIIKSHKR